MAYGWSVWGNIWPIPGWFGAEAMGWTDPLPMPAPGLAPASTQGMGIAVDYISGDERPDIIACYIINPPGENQGLTFMGERLLAWP
jgi:hypothetical protein